MPKDSKEVSSNEHVDKCNHFEHIRRGFETARRGDFATDAEVKAFFDKYGKPPIPAKTS
ncbi:MAG: hypothetical protein ACHQ6U_04450 [Thermodesulfobacteriota bacterium]